MADPLKALLDAGAIRSTPFPPNSRYANVIIAQVAAADGTLRVCLRRRFVPALAAAGCEGKGQASGRLRPFGPTHHVLRI